VWGGLGVEGVGRASVVGLCVFWKIVEVMGGAGEGEGGGLGALVLLGLCHVD